MPYGSQLYDPIEDTFTCEFPIEDDETGKYYICGCICQDLARHVTRQHGITTAEYKQLLGINRSEKLMSRRTQEKLRQINQEKGLDRNLKPQHFIKGDNSKQSYIRRQQNKQRLKKLHTLRRVNKKDILKFDSKTSII
jgi:hypothetical protein